MNIEDSILKELKETYSNLLQDGKLLSKDKLENQYRNFRSHFGLDVLAGYGGEELLMAMHGHSGDKDRLVYWLEFKNDEEYQAQKFGGISGGSALNYGMFCRKADGAWVTGSSRKHQVISVEEAIVFATNQYDQLVKGAKLLEALPPDANERDYEELQNQLDTQCPDISDAAWAHKYFHMLYPEKLDDYHTEFVQRYHLIKLLQMPPEKKGRYVAAGHIIALSRLLDMSVHHTTAVLNERDGHPHKYWRVGTKEETRRDRWDLMRDGGCVAIGWPALGDLSEFKRNTESCRRIKALMSEKHSNKIPQTAGKQGMQVYRFTAMISEGDIVIAADGETIIGIGKVISGYNYEPSSDFCHRREVEWISFEEWKTPYKSEGLQTTVYEMKKEINLIEIETRILNLPEIETPTDKITGIIAQVKSILERKGQVILYGPPGTGKTYWAEMAALILATNFNLKKSSVTLTEEENVRVRGDDSHPNSMVRFCAFHPAYGYENFIEGFKPETKNDQLVFEEREGIFKKLCSDAEKDSQNRYYLIIDEINRGDIPRIFGELIMLIEKNKRGKSLALPISGKPFSVPKNVFIIGTMNTADRSISLLDTALRRRFGFIELMPDSKVLGNAAIEGIPLGPWLDALNARICKNIGRDARNLQVGHSYLLEKESPIKDFSTFSKVLREDIIPLLEEYCYEDYGALEKILGKSLVDVAKQQVRHELFAENKKDELLQAIRNPCPEIFTSPQALNADIENFDSDEEDEVDQASDENGA